MRLLISLAFLFGVFMSVPAQDLLIKRNGDELLVKVIEVMKEDIKYKKFSNIDGPLYTMSKTEIFMIKYENGEKELFSDFEIPDSESPLSNSRNERFALRIELGGEAMIGSFQCEYLCLYRNKYKLGVRAGIGSGDIRYPTWPYWGFNFWQNERYLRYLNVPLSITNLVGDGRHLYEGGIGVAFLVGKNKPLENPLVHVTQGYRFKPDDKKYFFSGNVNLLMDWANGDAVLMPGIAFGKTF